MVNGYFYRVILRLSLDSNLDKAHPNLRSGKETGIKFVIIGLFLCHSLCLLKIANQ